jgi:hypothetical protein
MAEQGFFPFNPMHSTWEDWNGNLIMFYSEQPIPYNVEDNWKETAKNLVQLPTFLLCPVPDPDLYEDWQDWADEFTLIVNGKIE